MEKQPCDPTLGADIEMILFDYATDEPVPVCGLLDGTKESPYYLGNGVYVQEDNVMPEFNVEPAPNNWIDFVDNVQTALRFVDDYIQDKHGAGKYYMKSVPGGVFFNEADLQSEQAQTFGCDADYSAYDGGCIRTVPKNIMASNYRGIGGHVHFGGDFQCPDFVAALFAEFYIQVVAGINPMKSERMKWYGQPGVFRSKPYGIEYRSLDSTWADDQRQRELLSMYGMMCAQYLTNTSAGDLREAFRSIPWTSVREYVLAPDENYKLRDMLMNIATDAGVRW